MMISIVGQGLSTPAKVLPPSDFMIKPERPLHSSFRRVHTAGGLKTLALAIMIMIIINNITLLHLLSPSKRSSFKRTVLRAASDWFQVRDCTMFGEHQVTRDKKVHVRQGEDATKHRKLSTTCAGGILSTTRPTTCKRGIILKEDLGRHTTHKI